jgi:hypothetical protein
MNKTHICGQYLTSIGARVFDTLEYIDVLFYFQSLNHVTQSTHEAAPGSSIAATIHKCTIFKPQNFFN